MMLFGRENVAEPEVDSVLTSEGDRKRSASSAVR